MKKKRFLPMVEVLEGRQLPAVSHLDITQIQMIAGASLSVGDTDVKLLNFSVAAQEGKFHRISMVATLGTLDSFTKYQLIKDSNYDGIAEASAPGIVMGNTLVFNIPLKAMDGGNFLVIGQQLKASFFSTFQLGIMGAYATDAKTLRPEPVQLHSSPHAATIFTIVHQPELLVQEVLANPRFSPAPIGSTIVVESLVVTSLTNTILTNIKVAPLDGYSTASIKNVILFADYGNGGNPVQLGSATQSIANGYNSYNFVISQPIKAGQSIHFVVKTTVVNLVAESLQMSLLGKEAVIARHSNGSLLAIDRVFTKFAAQTLFGFGDDFD